MAGGTSEVIVGFALVDFTMSVLERERFVTFFAGVIDFFFATQDCVQQTGVVDERVVFGTVDTDFMAGVKVRDTVFDTLHTSSTGEDEA